MSSPIRQLYEVLSVYEANRDWSKKARQELLERVAARLPPLHQPDVFMIDSMLEEIGLDPLSTISSESPETIPKISALSRLNASRLDQPPRQGTIQLGDASKAPLTLSPQLANLMTTKEMASYVMLQLFGELAEQRIENWARIARLLVTQPMDGFATPQFEP
ncbi:1972_t:CDS:1 [Acaulospora colombiana]|uniref:1972_t:CDS:1 n=1 Tax=Acaulospora colombiana TaxID=27376 RepID=A0ACA9KJE6_9GLOM|nr:1972_t:CDS:1 [Acaulospora colombiana]